MSEEKYPVLVVDLQLAGSERRGGPYRRVFMTRDEFASELRKIQQRLTVVETLLASRNGLTNRERRALHREKKHLSNWLNYEPIIQIGRHSWWNIDYELRIGKSWSFARHSSARKRKLRWLARKHPSWVSEAESRIIQGWSAMLNRIDDKPGIERKAKKSAC